MQVNFLVCSKVMLPKTSETYSPEYWDNRTNCQFSIACFWCTGDKTAFFSLYQADKQDKGGRSIMNLRTE